MAELKKTLSGTALVAVGAAGLIGSSFVYLSSQLFAEFSAGGVIIGMLLATFLACCVALAISELTSSFPRAGGEFVYAYLAFNRPVGFLMGWLAVGVFCGIVAFYVTATGFLLGQVIPALNTIPLYSIGGEAIHLPVLMIGLGMLFLNLWMNWYGTTVAFSIQVMMFITIVVLGLAVVFVGFDHGDISNFLPAFNEELTGRTSWSSVFSFVLPALGFLTGFSIVAILAEEASVSARQVGRIVILSVVIAGAFYTLMFMATAWVIPWETTASFSSGTIDAFRHAGFPIIAYLAFAIGVLGLLTTFLAVFSSVSRLLFSLARAGLLPKFLARIDNEQRIPRNALLFTTVIGIALGWLGPKSLVWLLNVGGVYVAMMWLLTVLTFYRLRKTLPSLHRPYRVRLTWFPAIGGVAALLIIAANLLPGTGMTLKSNVEYMILCSWLVFGVLVYLFTGKDKSQQANLEDMLGDSYEAFAKAKAQNS
ncbi:APC family permease [Marinobacter sp. 1-3A]|uniref:APC family permease n=1 Tax=Marinobacter sp. 1-3A TaxID=2582920 RepID=UPI0019073C2B|nr:APC family permease [Marinobacter sp. 1-3A]MBK1874991.1 APC family permease [Marinobacter sp. 1-3A]